MKSSWANAAAVIAAILTTGSWLPQVIKTWRTREAGDFSWVWLASFATGVAMWAVYGFARNDIPIILTNVVTFLLVLSIAGVKIRGR
jgi:MtN3 and saliva related transmembrane protein